jgi:hypothetical protein
VCGIHFLSSFLSLIFSGGETPTLALLHSEEFKEEYDKLNDAERAEIVAAHEVNDYDRKRPTAQARVQDVTATLHTIRHLVQSHSFPTIKFPLIPLKSVSSRASMYVSASRDSFALSVILRVTI